MENQNLLLYKLMILYMLDRIDDYTLTNTQINNFLIDKGYADSFKIHETLSELIDQDFISVNTIRDINHYHITDLGEEALSFFENRISNNIKQEIREYFKEEKIKLREESEIIADYSMNGSDYIVECIIRERRDTLLDIKLNVPSKNIARQICENWRTKSTEVYQYLVEQLM